MEQHTLKNVNNCLNINIYSYLETSGVKVRIHIIILFIFSTPELIRNLWQLETAVFLYWSLLRAVPLKTRPKQHLGSLSIDIGLPVLTSLD
jgi:hypothetical protein